MNCGVDHGSTGAHCIQTFIPGLTTTPPPKWAPQMYASKTAGLDLRSPIRSRSIESPEGGGLFRSNLLLIRHAHGYSLDRIFSLQSTKKVKKAKREKKTHQDLQEKQNQGSLTWMVSL